METIVNLDWTYNMNERLIIIKSSNYVTFQIIGIVI